MVDLLRLLTWLSPSFPTGGFAYSSGLEWAVEHGISDEPALIAWIQDLLHSGSLWTDAILLRRAHRGEDVTELGLALATTAERRVETAAQGNAFVLAAAAWPGPAWGDEQIPYPVAVGKLAAAHHIDEDSATLAFLHAATANIGVAKAQLFPQLSLSATGGTSSSQLKGLVESKNLYYYAVGTASQQIFDGGKLRNNLRLARANDQELIDTYRQTIQGALRDVSNALIAYNMSVEDRLFCLGGMPPTLSFEQASDTLLLWARKRKGDAAGLSLGLAMLYSLKEAFPCKGTAR